MVFEEDHIKVQKENKFFNNVLVNILNGIARVTDDIFVNEHIINQFTIMAELNTTDIDKQTLVKIQLQTRNCANEYERLQVSVIGENGEIDSIFITFAEVMNAKVHIYKGMGEPYWQGKVLETTDYNKIGNAIYKYLQYFIEL